jgi:hypothetical protein
VVVDEHHDEVGSRGGEPAAELVEARVQPLALLRPRDVELARDERRVRRQSRGDDLGNAGTLRLKAIT